VSVKQSFAIFCLLSSLFTIFCLFSSLLLSSVCLAICCYLMSVPLHFFVAFFPHTHAQHLVTHRAANITPVVMLTACFCLQKVFLKLQRQFTFSINIIVSSGYNVTLYYCLIYKSVHADNTKFSCISQY